MFKKNHNQSMGQYGENIAKKYYQELGYEIIAQNYHSRYGEIDLLCKKEGLILIVEVKTRQGNRYGYGEEIINNQKIKGLIHTYQIFAAIHNLPNYFDIEICVIELKNQEKTIKRFLL